MYPRSIYPMTTFLLTFVSTIGAAEIPDFPDIRVVHAFAGGPSGPVEEPPPRYERVAVVLGEPFADRYEEGEGIRTGYKLRELERLQHVFRKKRLPTILTKGPTDHDCLVDPAAPDVTVVEFSRTHATDADEHALVRAVHAGEHDAVIVLGNLRPTILRQLQTLRGEGKGVAFVSNMVFREDGRMLRIRSVFGPDFESFGLSSYFH